MPTLLDSILGTGIKGVGEAVSGVLDKCITTADDRLKAKEGIMNVITDYSKSLVSSARDVLVVELQGNWLQKSWRPILMLAFGFIIVYEYFISSIFNLPKSNLPDKFWTLLEIGMGGYVIGRTAEKVADSVTNNWG